MGVVDIKNLQAPYLFDEPRWRALSEHESMHARLCWPCFRANSERSAHFEADRVCNSRETCERHHRGLPAGVGTPSEVKMSHIA